MIGIPPDLDLDRGVWRGGCAKIGQMDYSEEKVDEAVLALLWLTSYADGEYGRRAWRSHDLDALGRLHRAGLIGVVGTAKSVTLTADGESRARELFSRLFGE